MVYGDSLKSSLVGVVNLDADEIPQMSTETGVSSSDMDAFCKDPKVNKLIVDRLLKTSQVKKLKGFERIKKVFIDPKTFEQNKLTTATFKLKRNVAKEHYQKDIDEMYKGVN